MNWQLLTRKSIFLRVKKEVHRIAVPTIDQVFAVKWWEASQLKPTRPSAKRLLSILITNYSTVRKLGQQAGIISPSLRDHHPRFMSSKSQLYDLHKYRLRIHLQDRHECPSNTQRVLCMTYYKGGALKMSHTNVYNHMVLISSYKSSPNVPFCPCTSR